MRARCIRAAAACGVPNKPTASAAGEESGKPLPPPSSPPGCTTYKCDARRPWDRVGLYVTSAKDANDTRELGMVDLPYVLALSDNWPVNVVDLIQVRWARSTSLSCKRTPRRKDHGRHGEEQWYVQTGPDFDTLSSDTADSLREQVRQVHQLLDEVQKEVLKSRGEIGESSKGGSPFTPEIQGKPLPATFRLPTLEPYDGSGDPTEHIAAFRAQMAL
ncbi:hypothetical protein GW17_00005628, partial [Ensete ventricosum]